MKKVLIALSVLVLFGSNVPSVLAWKLNFAPTTTYTDGTPIESGLSVVYDAWQDGVSLGTVTASPFQTLDNVYGATKIYKVRSRLSDGRASDNAVATLTSPLDNRPPSSPPAGALSLGR